MMKFHISALFANHNALKEILKANLLKQSKGKHKHSAKWSILDSSNIQILCDNKYEFDLSVSESFQVQFC